MTDANKLDLVFIGTVSQKYSLPFIFEILVHYQLFIIVTNLIMIWYHLRQRK